VWLKKWACVHNVNILTQRTKYDYMPVQSSVISSLNKTKFVVHVPAYRLGENPYQVLSKSQLGSILLYASKSSYYAFWNLLSGIFLFFLAHYFQNYLHNSYYSPKLIMLIIIILYLHIIILQ